MQLILAVWMLLAPGPVVSADPCVCEIKTVEEEYKKAGMIFTGRVVNIQSAKDQTIVEFELDQVWKGERKPILRVTTSRQTCGYSFDMDQTYLVYTAAKETLFVDPCSRTNLADKSQEDMKKLAVLAESAMSRSDAPRRDPFLQMKGDRLTDNQAGAAIPKTLTVTTAVIVGITKRGSGHIALIRGSDGKTYTMKEGDRLYDGKILQIDSNSITFAQYIGSSTKQIKKKLHPFEE